MGTHFTLLREPQSNAAKVFLFGERVGGQKIDVWKFFADSSTVRLPDTLNGSASVSRFFKVPHPDSMQNDLFCNGHAPLPDGRMLFVGGWFAPNNVCEMTYLFRPSWLPDSGGTPWTLGATMATERWYATATSMADGRILASGGLARNWHASFGGMLNSGQTDRVWHSLAVAGRSNWGDTTAVPGYAGAPQGGRAPSNGYTGGRFPLARTDHAFAWAPNGQGLVFGGRYVGAAGVDTVLSDTWMFLHADERVPGDSVATWQLLMPLANDTTVGVPCARTRAAFVWAGYDNNDSRYLPDARDSLTCFLFGGRDSLGNVLGDLWQGNVSDAYYDAAYGMVRLVRWRRLLADAAERRRFGHSMWFDPGDADQSGAPYARLLIFGGQIGDSTLASAKVYRYGVGSSVSAVWDSVSPSSSGSTWGIPVARQGHAFTHRWPMGFDHKVEFFFYGGQDARGNLLVDPTWTPRLDSHVWSLTRGGTATSPTYKWNWIAWTNPDSGWAGPDARARSAMVYDDESGRLVMSGGDLNGDGQYGGLTDTLWTLQLSSSYVAGSKRGWKRPVMRSLGHDPMPASSGHTMISYGDGGYRMDNSLEMYSVGVTGDQCDAGVTATGSWKTFTTQDSLSQRAIAWYPFLFLLPDGRLFNAGPAQGDRPGERPYRRFLNMDPLGAHYREWTDNSSVYWKDTWAPGSAVMYRPGKILRAGSHAGDDETRPATVATSHTETIAIAAAELPAWEVCAADFETTWPLQPRLNHNLTVLPTGDVLATGGVSGDLKTGGGPVQRPQLWSVQTGGWNDTSSVGDLAHDPKIRNYHSSALLLPDGRVMTAGGEKPNITDRNTVSIYEPPYLFTVNGHYARRPVINDCPEHLRYGEPFTLAIGSGADSADVDSIRGVALLRPGAATHGFDQSQRYVPLDFVARKNRHRLLAWAPVDSSYAPPGEYMLFVTRGRGNDPDSMPVPSLAKWVIVERPQDVQRDSLDTTPPRGSAYLDLQRKNLCDTNYEVELKWKAPADDDTIKFSGKARSYNLRWIENTSPPHFNLWNSQTTSAPQEQGAIDSVTVSGLDENVWYRFALTAIGDNADTSSVSNVLIAKALSCDEGIMGGSGGGEGSSGRRAGASSAHSTQASHAEENTLLAGVELGVHGSDVLHLNQAPSLLGGTRRAYVRQGQQQGLLVDQARLLAVDHASGTEVVALPGGALNAGTRTAATRVLNRASQDVTASAVGSDTEPVFADSGEVLEVHLAEQSEAASRVLLFDLMGGGSTGGGVEVEARQGGEQWQQVTTLHPRREWDPQSATIEGGSVLRLTFRDAYALRFVGDLAGAVSVQPLLANLVGAQSGYSGDVYDSGREAVDTTLAMVAGDTLTLAFHDLEPAAEGNERTWLLGVEGTPVTPRLAQSLAQQRNPVPQVSLPTRFALLPPAPNPTRGTVRLSFDLPVRSSARLEIFDPQGRRVRRFDGAFGAGRQSFEWDLRHGDGPRVAAGLYTYRLLAGSFKAVGRVVVLR